MRCATKATVAAFGTLAAMAGLEHGVGEVLQGNVAPEGLFILSWPDSAFFRTLSGEPAMTVVPNLLVTGILAILAALALLVWATMFVQRPHGGLILILLSVVLLLVGGGFGPPLLGIILGLAATTINAPLGWWRDRVSPGVRRLLGAAWPWSLGAGLVAWLLLFPGSTIASYYYGVDDPGLTVTLIALAFGFLFLTIVAGIAHDSLQQPVLARVPSRRR